MTKSISIIRKIRAYYVKELVKVVCVIALLVLLVTFTSLDVKLLAIVVPIIGFGGIYIYFTRYRPLLQRHAEQETLHGDIYLDAVEKAIEAIGTSSVINKRWIELYDSSDRGESKGSQAD